MRKIKYNKDENIYFLLKVLMILSLRCYLSMTNSAIKRKLRDTQTMIGVKSRSIGKTHQGTYLIKEKHIKVPTCFPCAPRNSPLLQLVLAGRFCQAMWLWNLLWQMHVRLDNIHTINLAKSPIARGISKHIETNSIS